MRSKAAFLIKKNDIIEWRSKEPSRLETFSDGVFAFAVTLVIVSLEVPKTFTGLYETMKGAFSFAACFAILFSIWNNQNIYFRRYGLNDSRTVVLNALLLFVVLIYVYPLKFLSAAIFSNNLYAEGGELREMITIAQTPALMLIYGAGYTTINFIFFLLYRNAKQHKEAINLNAAEVFETDSFIGIYLITTAIGVLAMLLAGLLPVEVAGLSGLVYFSIAFSYFFWFRHRHRKSRRLFSVNPLQAASGS